MIKKIKAIDPKIIAYNNTNSVEPYYSIEYYDTADNKWHIGYGSCHYYEVLSYLKKYFIKVEADVAPVRHGHWIKTSLMFASSNGKHGNVHVCSNCGEQSGVGLKTPYCAICGAKMDGKENNDNE